MAEPCLVPAGDDGGHEVRVEGLWCVAHRVDAVVDAMQPALANAPHDGVRVEPAVDELAVPDQAVLSGGAAGGAQIRRRSPRGGRDERRGYVPPSCSASHAATTRFAANTRHASSSNSPSSTGSTAANRTSTYGQPS